MKPSLKEIMIRKLWDILWYILNAWWYVTCFFGQWWNGWQNARGTWGQWEVDIFFFLSSRITRK